jgi:RNA polymerase sigma-70 factor, ECF subfamily
MPTDEELMLAVGKDDLQAFEEIVHRHQRSAWNTAYRFLADAEEAEDVVQNAFLRILDAAPHYRPIASFRTYLYRIVTRLCMDRARKCRPIYTDKPLDPPDPSPSASEKLLVKEANRVVRTSLDMLPQKQRMAIVLKYYEGLSYREIASILENTEKAVERLLARARASLEASLSEWMRN